MSTNDTTPKKRRTRRNFRTEIMQLETYITLYVDILSETPSESLSEFQKGQLNAFDRVLTRLRREVR